MSQLSIGVDVGSTSIKAVALDRDTKTVIRVESVELDPPVSGTPTGHHEQAPAAIREKAFSLIRTLGEAFGDRIVAIAFTGQMHSGMFVNASLRPQTNLVTWQDKRGDEPSKSGKTYVEVVREAVGEDPTGVGMHAGFLAVTARWFAENRLELSPGTRAIGVYDWLTSLLIGKPVTDITSAAAWGVYDIVKKQWKASVLEAARIPDDTLPEIVEPGSELGLIDPGVADELQLPRTTSVFASIGDTQASFLGAGVRSQEILLNFGTGSQSMWGTDSPVATPGTDIRYLCQDRYIVTSPTLAGGKAYQTLAEFYRSVFKAFGADVPTLPAVYEVLNRLANTASAQAIIFDPTFAGSRWKRPEERATISGLTADNFRIEALTRALLEGMIEEVAAPYFIREGSVKHSALVGAGNGMRRNPALRAAAENRFGLPLRLAESEEEAARGAALLTLATSALP